MGDKVRVVVKAFRGNTDIRLNSMTTINFHKASFMTTGLISFKFAGSVSRLLSTEDSIIFKLRSNAAFIKIKV